jgi:DNA polymerase III epsilon subunit-like protein
MGFFSQKPTAMPTEGVENLRVAETPVAIVDLETTGLVPGVDRVVEISVVRVDPDAGKTIVLDTLVNPGRRVAATEIHGINDANVRDAPGFGDIGGDVVDALSGAVVAAYNVYFDIKFLDYELGQLGVSAMVPHFCLMYLRPMLGIGPRCKLEEACKAHNIEYEAAHVAAMDATACGDLLLHYLRILKEKNVETFEDLAKLRNYKFTKSFSNPRFPPRHAPA